MIANPWFWIWQGSVALVVGVWAGKPEFEILIIVVLCMAVAAILTKMDQTR